MSSLGETIRTLNTTRAEALKMLKQKRDAMKSKEASLEKVVTLLEDMITADRADVEALEKFIGEEEPTKAMLPVVEQAEGEPAAETAA